MNHNYSKFIGENVKVNLGGPESRLGTLSHVASDFLAIQTQEGMMFYQLSHVKGISIQSTSSPRQNVESNELEDLKFTEVLNNFKYKQVRINRGGPESVVGLLRKTSNDYIELLVDKQIVILSVNHIKSFSPVFEAEKAESGKKEGGKNNSKITKRVESSSSSNNNAAESSAIKESSTKKESSSKQKESSSKQKESSSQECNIKKRKKTSKKTSKKCGSKPVQSRPSLNLTDKGWTKL